MLVKAAPGNLRNQTMAPLFFNDCIYQKEFAGIKYWILKHCIMGGYPCSSDLSKAQQLWNAVTSLPQLIFCMTIAPISMAFPLKQIYWNFGVLYIITCMAPYHSWMSQFIAKLPLNIGRKGVTPSFSFYPMPVLVLRYCRCLRLSVRVRVVNHVFVRAITHHSFRFGSTKSDQRWKTHWLRPLLFCGTIDLGLQG